LPASRQIDDIVASDAGQSGALKTVGANDLVVAWLKPDELSAVRAMKPAPDTVYLSATLSGDSTETALGALSDRSLMVQTMEMPKIRNANLMRFDAWAEGSRVPVLDRKMQSEVYFAVRSFVSIQRGMLNNLHTEYLIERAESTLSMFEAMQVQDEVQSLMMAPVNKRPVTLQEVAQIDPQTGKSQYENLLRRGGTTMYPRLSLAPGQRIASKGAYVLKARNTAPSDSVEPEWVIP